MKKEDKNGIVILGVYVNDSLIAGHTKAIEKAVKLLKNKYIVKKFGELKEKLDAQSTLKMDVLTCPSKNYLQNGERLQGHI